MGVKKVSTKRGEAVNRERETEVWGVAVVAVEIRRWEPIRPVTLEWLPSALRVLSGSWEIKKVK